jgi:hypothetical protein
MRCPPLRRLNFGRSMRREQRFKELIATHMSPDLQGIVVAHCYARYLQDVPYFQYKPAHLRGIGRLRAEEETTRFLTQVRQAAARFYCFFFIQIQRRKQGMQLWEVWNVSRCEGE